MDVILPLIGIFIFFRKLKWREWGKRKSIIFHFFPRDLAITLFYYIFFYFPKNVSRLNRVLWRINFGRKETGWYKTRDGKGFCFLKWDNNKLDEKVKRSFSSTCYKWASVLENGRKLKWRKGRGGRKGKVYGGEKTKGAGRKGKKGWRGIAVILMSLRDLSCLNRNSTTETFHHQKEKEKILKPR